MKYTELKRDGSSKGVTNKTIAESVMSIWLVATAACNGAAVGT